MSKENREFIDNVKAKLAKCPQLLTTSGVDSLINGICRGDPRSIELGEWLLNRL